MSWLFSQALVEACSLGTSSAIGQCAQLNVMPTQQPFWRSDKMMEPSLFSRFGQTYAHLTDDRGAGLLTAYLAGFPVRTSALPGRAKDLPERAPDSGESFSASFGRLSPDGSGWRTVQCSLLEDSPQSLRTLPRSGSMRSGTLYLRPTLAPGISVSGFGLLLPTLTVCGNYNAKGASPTSGDGLVTALKRMFPNLVGGPLNPDWCEWFMGFPMGWTASAALGMHKFHEWQQQHSECSQIG